MTPVQTWSVAMALTSVLATTSCQNQVQTPQAEGARGAALNVGLGAAMAPLHRAATGCYTPCAYGTVCDEKNGVCVSQEAPAPSASVEVPLGAPTAAPPMQPVCSPGCLGEQVCVLEASRPVCKPAAAPAP